MNQPHELQRSRGLKHAFMQQSHLMTATSNHGSQYWADTAAAAVASTAAAARLAAAQE
jgi:hypothetical protein